MLTRMQQISQEDLAQLESALAVEASEIQSLDSRKILPGKV